MTAYWYRTCPICEQGRLFVEVREDTQRPFLKCEECYSAWEKPEDVADKNKSFLAMGIDSHRVDNYEFERINWREMNSVVTPR